MTDLDKNTTPDLQSYLEQLAVIVANLCWGGGYHDQAYRLLANIKALKEANDVAK